MELDEKVDGLERTIVDVKKSFMDFKSDVAGTLNELRNLIASKEHEIKTLQGKIEALEKNFAEEDEVNTEVETPSETPEESEPSTETKTTEEEQEKENEPTA